VAEPKLTPMMQQWAQAKSQHPDAILLFRMGDFYELFGDDAIRAAPILELVLTCRDKDKNGMKMAGFPYSAAANYINILVDHGYKVAICDQLEDPKSSKGLVKRGISQVITPGTLIEDEESASLRSSFLVALVGDEKELALAVLDLSRARFLVTSSAQPNKIIDELVRISPKEIVSIKADKLAQVMIEKLIAIIGHKTAIRQEYKAKPSTQMASLEQQAVMLISSYLIELRGCVPEHIGQPVRYSIDDQLLLDQATIDNLDLLPKKKGDKANLLSVLARCKTSIARKLLAQELLAPPTSLPEIQRRQLIVGEFLDDADLREDSREYLSGCYDLAKLTALCASAKINPRGLSRVRDCLGQIGQIKTRLAHSHVPELNQLISKLPDLSEIKISLARALVDNPPINLKDGNIFRRGFDAELDQLWELSSNSQNMLIAIEQREREHTGIGSLKIRYTRVFGYYIEITRSNLDKVPSSYQRKQTIANGERYVTPELNELELKLNSAQEKMAMREYQLFDELRLMVLKQAESLMLLSQTIAFIDMLAGFAELAALRNWSRPEILNKEACVLDISQGRHPILEDICASTGTLFVPNSLRLDRDSCSLALITGPNMAGKSTLMRQMALMQIMAHLGSYVPAKSAKISLCDSIFARVGASDDLASGRSTFMVEMTETSHILHNATPYSLIILDEIGRGTSTYDGMALAQAIAEYIHNTIGARTMFATHYHELVELENKLTRLKNYHVEVEEREDGVRFIYMLLAGPARESFGIAVAKLAGLPEQVLERARVVLVSLEHKDLDEPKPPADKPQLDLFGQVYVSSKDGDMRSSLDKILGLDINRVTPIQALSRLASLQMSLRQALKNPLS